MRILTFVATFTFLLACNVPAGPDQEHPLYVPDPNRLFFLNTRQLDYELVLDDQDAGIRAYLSKDLNGEDLPLKAYIIDYWVLGRAGLVLQMEKVENSALSNPLKTLEDILTSSPFAQFSSKNDSKWIVFTRDMPANAENGSILFQALMNDLDLNIRSDSEDSFLLRSSEKSYRHLRIVLNDYLKLIRTGQ
ncbi:MAG: hypothetical protein AAF544_01620 [Bacteroidota bacterium]